MSIDEPHLDPFDGLLELENTFYQEGYDLGVSDGQHAGLIEGRAFGLEKGFEKYVAMGRLHGRASVWAGRLSQQQLVESERSVKASPDTPREGSTSSRSIAREVGIPPVSLRLESHVRTLYALTELESLSTENSEDTIGDFDDRLKRAEGKLKVLERITGESLPNKARIIHDHDKDKHVGDGNIEDLRVLHARH